MKKCVWIMIALTGLCFIRQKANAQVPVVNLITAAVKKVITALDIRVQQLQNETIWLQNAEKNLENQMSLNSLNDIGSWLGKERDLFNNYYQELSQVKTVISGYDEVLQIMKKQVQLVNEYKSAYALFKQDKNFSPDEVAYMGKGYDGILQESIKNLDEVLLAINALSTQMTDGQRLELIHRAGTHVQTNLNDVRQFNGNNMQLTLQRASANNDMQSVKQLYGLQ